jgi:hypothetical protein
LTKNLEILTDRLQQTYRELVSLEQNCHVMSLMLVTITDVLFFYFTACNPNDVNAISFLLPGYLIVV